MNKKKETSIIRNFIYNSLYQIISVITPLITSPYISRKLGAEPLGIYGYTYAVANYFLIFAMLGVKNYGNRSIARVRDNRRECSKIFCSIYVFQLISSGIFVTGYVIYLMLFHISNMRIALIQGLLVMSAMLDITWLFFGLELFKTTTIRNISVKLLSVAAILLFVKLPEDLWIYTVIMAGGTLLSQLVMWPFVPKYIDWHRPSWNSVIQHFRPNCVLFIPVIATNLYKYMDKIMLGNMSTMMFLGYYENAERLVQIPNSLVTALGTVMLPRMSNMVKKGQNNIYFVMIQKSMVFAVFMSAAFSFGIMTVSKAFVPFFFGEEFIPVIGLLYILCPIMIFISWADVIRTQYLLPNSLDKSFLVSVLTGAGVNLVINALLIPQMKAQGAAIGTLFAEATVCLLQTFFVVRKLPVAKYFVQCMPFVVIGFVMWYFVHDLYMNNIVTTIIVQILLGGGMYLTLSYIYLRFINKEKLFNEKI